MTTQFAHLSERERRRITEPPLPSLFDPPPVVNTQSQARHDDPATSHEAKDMNRVTRGSERYRLLTVFSSAPTSLTDDLASQLAGVEYYEGRRRCADLRRYGLVADSGEVGLSRFGNSAMTCVITDDGRKALDASNRAVQ